MFCTIDWTQKSDKVTIGPTTGDREWQTFHPSCQGLTQIKHGHLTFGLCEERMPLRTGCQDVHLGAIDCVKSKVKQVKHLRTVSKRFTDVYSISSRMAWDWCKMVCSSVVKLCQNTCQTGSGSTVTTQSDHSRSWGPGPANARSKTTGLLQGQASLPSSANFLAY